MKKTKKRKKLRTRKSDRAEILETAVYEVAGERIVLNAINLADNKQVYVTSDKAELPFILTPKQALDYASSPQGGDDPAVELVCDFMASSGLITEEELTEARKICEERTNNADAIDAERIVRALNNLMDEVGDKAFATDESKEAFEELQGRLEDAFGPIQAGL